MSEDSSSGEEWCLSIKRKVDDCQREAKCWECGKIFSKITNLMSHYKSHDIKATCYICSVTFRRLTSLFMHLDNVHLPPSCSMCNHSFSNVWDLNKHAERYCRGPAKFQKAPSLTFAVTDQIQNSYSVPSKVTARQTTNSAQFQQDQIQNSHVINNMTAQQNTNCTPFQNARPLTFAVTGEIKSSYNVPNNMTAQQTTNSLSELRPQQRVEMKSESPEMPENSVKYVAGEDDKKDIVMESECKRADNSTSSESDDENKTSSKLADLSPDDPESEGGSSSTNDSSDSSRSMHSKNTLAALPNINNPMCAACGRGPFRSMKLHLLHCSGIRVKYQCSVCKNIFLTEESIKEHYMPLYSCEICGQVFPQESLYRHHPCPKGSKSPLVLFCAESMPQACNICKSFFTSEKTLSEHVTRVHTTVVSTKVCIITNPSVLTDKRILPGVHGTAAISRPNMVNKVINGHLFTGHNHAQSLSTVRPPMPHPGRPPATLCMASAAALVGSGKDFALGPNNQPSSRQSAPLCRPPSATHTISSTATSDPVPPPMPTIIAMFENDSHDIALMKRMNTDWRSKATYPCRQCGAISRQPSLIISHRYLHRGHRTHQCQCGRAFKHRLHLLRHCVQHAETVSYICVSCGETFTGAKLLAEHIKGKSQKKSQSGRKCKCKVKRTCKMPFTCGCGQLFLRPSAYIWHQLKNMTKTKQLKKPLG
ncbi:zinc finger protein with KRAB and SCAN domains 8 [Plectropomus leopardus]|uniref:zinc finger protein with KRAB and SCAN domains 8 n=1 Tax=Plectropomus leopardus TaxID=160734 RepID=UPI001C4B3302|nr:zinc finger protein with KRAB and SCAN domains 8 [Plectropomus leopardus]